MSEQDSRHPYTYAADFVRSIAGYGESGTKLSRSDASAIRSKLCEILGLDDATVAKSLADYYLANKSEIEESGSRQMLNAILNSRP